MVNPKPTNRHPQRARSDGIYDNTKKENDK